MKKNQILIFGGGGLVGTHFIHQATAHDLPLYYPSRKEVDILDKSSLKKIFLAEKPAIVINFAAYTNLDKSEEEKGDKTKLTWLTNVIGVKNLITFCRQTNTFFIQISTDSVFPGTNECPGPYSEHMHPAKNKEIINWYGYTKLIAEEEIKQSLKQYAIIRISHPFGDPKSERDLVAKTIRDVQRGSGLFSDQIFTPTFLDDLNSTLYAIIKKKYSGIFHVASKGLVSRLKFGQYIATKQKLKDAVVASSMEVFIKKTFPRIRLGGLSTDDTEKTLGVNFHAWEQALDITLSRV